MAPTYPVVMVRIVIVFRGLGGGDVSDNLLEAIRRAVARILRIPVNRVVITGYFGARRLGGPSIRALDDGISVEMDLEADSDELISDDTSSGGNDGESANDAGAAMNAVTETISSAASSGDLATAVADSAQEVAEEVGDTELAATVSAVEIDSDAISYTNMSPTAQPTELPAGSSSKSNVSSAVIFSAFAAAGILLLTAIGWFYWRHRSTEYMKKRKEELAQYHEKLDLESNMVLIGSEGNNSNYYSTPLKPRQKGSMRSGEKSRPIGSTGSAKVLSSPHLDQEDEETKDEPAPTRNPGRFFMSLSPSFLESAPEEGNATGPQPEEYDEDSDFVCVSELTVKAINLRNKNNRRRSIKGSIKGSSKRAKPPPPAGAPPSLKKIIIDADGKVAGGGPSEKVGLPPKNKRSPTKCPPENLSIEL